MAESSPYNAVKPNVLLLGTLRIGKSTVGNKSVSEDCKVFKASRSRVGVT